MKPKNEVIEKFEKFAPGLFAEAEAEEKKQLLAARQEKAAALKKIHAQVEKDVARLLDEQAKMRQAVKDAEAVFLTKRQALGDVNGRLSSTRHAADVQTRKLENYLIATAHPELDSAIRFFQKKLEWLRKPGRIQGGIIESRRNIVSWSKKTKGTTNRRYILLALDYCQKAIELLRAAKLDPVLDTDKIQELKDNIPDISQRDVISSEKSRDSEELMAM